MKLQWSLFPKTKHEEPSKFRENLKKLALQVFVFLKSFANPKNLLRLFKTLRAISILQTFLKRPPENTFPNKHKTNISDVLLTLQGYICLAR